MKTNKFLQLDQRFCISGLLYPRIGGPHIALSHLIRGPVQAYWNKLAGKVEYITVSPYEALDLTNSLSSWSLDPKFERFYTNLQYGEMPLFIPRFLGTGIMYSAVFDIPVCFPGSRIQEWAPIDQKTSIGGVADIAQNYYREKVSGRWRLFDNETCDASRILFFLRKKWAVDSHESCSYEIFIPPESPLSENAEKEATLPDSVAA